MKKEIFFISLLLLIIQAFSNLSKEKRQELIKKYIKVIYSSFLEEDSLNEINLGLNLNQVKIDYDFNEIKKKL